MALKFCQYQPLQDIPTFWIESPIHDIELRKLSGAGPFSLSSRKKSILRLLKSNNGNNHLESPSDSLLLFLIDDNGWATNYFHWHVDFLLPLASIIDKKPSYTNRLSLVLENKNQKQTFQLESLLAMGFKKSQILSFEDIQELRNSSVIANRLIIPCDRFFLNSPRDYLSGHSLFSLSSQISAYSADTNDTRILISRRDADTRRLINEDAIFEKFLKHRGFQVVEMSSISYSEQVQLFRRASIVIAPHGAALTNLIFTKYAKVLEIFSLGHGVRPDYYQISLRKNIVYSCYVDTASRPSNDVYLPEDELICFLES